MRLFRGINQNDCVTKNLHKNLNKEILILSIESQSNFIHITITRVSQQ